MEKGYLKYNIRISQKDDKGMLGKNFDYIDILLPYFEITLPCFDILLP